MNSDYGPHRWKRVNVEDDFFHTFDLKAEDTNNCGSGDHQSPIDVCTKPRGNCKETHEMRPKVKT